MRPLDLIARLNERFTTLQERLRNFQFLLTDAPWLTGRVFELPEVEKGREHQPVTGIPVIQHLGAQALSRGLEHFQRMFIYHQNQNSSAKAAIRLPGALCFDVDEALLENVLALTAEINRLKAELSHMITVESALPPEQRFEFVHTHLRGLKTLSAYRALQVIVDPWSVRFGWANKQIIKNLTRAEVLAMLKKSLEAGRAVPPYSKEQWSEKIRQEMDVIGKLPPDIRLKIRRPVKVQPIARVWYQEQQRQIQYACPSPLIVLCRRHAGAPVPQLGELTDYRRDTIRHKYKPASRPAHLVIERLHLYVAED
ncbi:DNA replication terminus site-binding protein [Sodalis sp. RH15]|uniref:DNA replication terminus site-binding protein n=1 Tax=Sodalis sp. RH15 TaxID=3394330 RepID=UPI0039B54C91